mmetsp:Transcript_8214/g.51060  ORF Transcript_8214/g.51060 Transcript_8214/m.51060 type:complete len:90 (-) Transcript_8214:145-414(-)
MQGSSDGKERLHQQIYRIAALHPPRWTQSTSRCCATGGRSRPHKRDSRSTMRHAGDCTAECTIMRELHAFPNTNENSSDGPREKHPYFV